jgi:hypothetical protein
MLKMLPFVPCQGIQLVRVTDIGQLRCTRDGRVEGTLVNRRINARGVVVYDEAVILSWPLEAMLAASTEFQAAKEILRQKFFQ